MLSTCSIAIYTLKSIIRSGFFWVSNLAAFLLILVLIYITYFDFEGDSAVTELFLTTLVLSGALNSLVFHGGAARYRSLRQWDLLATRPLRTASIAMGRFIGLTLIQLTVGLVFLGGFVIEAQLLQHSIPGHIWSGWSIAMLQIAMLGALYGLIGIWLSEFWAVAAMVGAFLLGHLSTYLQVSISPGLNFLISVAFCGIPDLDLSLRSSGGDVPGMWTEGLRCGWSYAISYIILMLYVSALSIRPALDRR